MLQKLREFFQGLGAEQFQQNQNEAILTMLTWVMMADGKIEPEENEKIDDFLDSIQWKNDTITGRDFVGLTVKRVKSIESGELTEEALLKEISTKLKGEEIRYKALKICQELAKADAYFDRAEKNLLKRFAATLM